MSSGTQRSTTPSGSTEPSVAPLQRKGRSVIACTRCRRRKIRCIASSKGPIDAVGNRACQYCVKHNHVCKYGTADAELTSPPSSPSYSLPSHGDSHASLSMNMFNYQTLPQSQWPGQYPHQGYDPMGPVPPVTNSYIRGCPTAASSFADSTPVHVSPSDPLTDYVVHDAPQAVASMDTYRSAAVRVVTGAAVSPTDSLLEAGDVPVSELERRKSSVVDIYSKLDGVKDTNGECSMFADYILPISVHHHLVDYKHEIYGILSAYSIAADTVTLASGFDKDIIQLKDVSPAGEFEAQRAFISCSNKFALAADELEHLLLELSTLLAPFSGVLETPTRNFCLTPFLNDQEPTSSHYRHLNITSLSDGPSPAASITLSSESFGESSGNGNDTEMAHNGSDESDNSSRRCCEEGDDPSDDDSDGNTGAGPDKTSGGGDESDGGGSNGGGNNGSDGGGGDGGGSGGSGDPIGPSPVEVDIIEPFAAFDINFKVKPFLSCRDMHSLRLKGTLESKELATQHYSSPDTISTSRVRFHKLEFHRTCSNISHRGKGFYHQFYARVDVETPHESPIYLTNVYPKSSQRIVDGKTKVTEAKEQTSGHQFIGSAKLDITSWIPFLATVSPSVSVSKTQTHKAALAKEHTENGARIEQVDTSCGLRWGYHVDDEWTRQNGLRLTDTEPLLPMAQFDFLGKEAGLECPEKLHVTVRSFWSLSPASESMSFFGGLMKAKGEVHFRDIGVQVTMELPPNLTKTWHIHRDVNAWVDPDCKNKIKEQVGGAVRDTYSYGDHGVPKTGTPFYALNDRDCIAPDILAP